jgi:hypothetical protein
MQRKKLKNEVDKEWRREQESEQKLIPKNYPAKITIPLVSQWRNSYNYFKRSYLCKCHCIIFQDVI